MSAPLWFAALHIANGASVTIVPGLVFLAVVIGAAVLALKGFILEGLNFPTLVGAGVYVIALGILRLYGVWSGDLLVPAPVHSFRRSSSRLSYLSCNAETRL